MKRYEEIKNKKAVNKVNKEYWNVLRVKNKYRINKIRVNKEVNKE